MPFLILLVGTGVLPLPPEQLERELRESLPGERLDLNLQAFRRGLTEMKKRAPKN